MAHSDITPTLYVASVAPLADPILYQSAYRTVSESRRQKTDRFRFPKDRCLSLGAELLLRHGLRAVGVTSFPTEFCYGDYGKPEQKNNNGIYFNLSHSEEYAACAIAPVPVGCDIEKIKPIDLNIAKRFFFHGEYDDIKKQPTPELKNDLFFRYWTLKESFMKVTGLGMHLPLDAFQIVRSHPISVIQSVDKKIYSFTEFDDISGYHTALCTADHPKSGRLMLADLEKILESE